MTVKINYSQKKFNKNVSNIVIFLGENLKINVLKKYLQEFEFNYINDLFKNIDKKKKLFIYDISSKKRIILVIIKNNLNIFDIQNMGAEFYTSIKYFKNNEYFIVSDSVVGKNNNFLGYFLHGIKLKSYEFKKYKSKKTENKFIINVVGIKNKPSVQTQLKFKSLEEGTFYTRDLVSEPGNILHPDEYVKRLITLKKDGLKITVFDKKKLKKLGMHSLLGVGMGSVRGSYLVTMEWNGAKDKSKPLAFVGKGVTFDTGGYSLKPAKFMEDMTYDMAGSAAVVGLMKTLALRKAKVNAVGIVGLVENMISGVAQRPGDIVKSYRAKQSKY